MKTIRWELGGVSQEHAAALCGVNPRTFRRWENGESEPPESAIKLLMVLAVGCLDTISPAWRGWRIIDNQLVSPDDKVYTPEWFGHMHFSFQKQQGERAEMRKRIRELEAENARLKADIQPGSANVIKFPGKIKNEGS